MEEKRKKKANRRDFIFLILSTIAAIALCVVLIRNFEETTVQTYIYKEMHMTAETQAEILHHEIEEQFTPLHMLAGQETQGIAFDDETERTILKLLKTENRFCALGRADRSGIGVNYDGTIIGDISERDYFTSVMSGETEEFAEYLSSTKRACDPRFIFAVPVYEGGTITAVIFASKEVSVISDVLLSATVFDGSERIYLTDENYHVLATNPAGSTGLEERDLSEKFALLREKSTKKESSGGFLADEKEYVTAIPLGINQWQMVVELDRENAENLYSDIARSLRRVADMVMLILASVLVYCVLVSHRRIERHKEDEERIFNQYSSYRALLEKLDCAVVEYNVRSDTLQANRLFMEKYADQVETQTLSMQKLNTIHPEFNFQELDEVINIVQSKSIPYSFETAITFTDGKVYWIEITLLPQSDTNGHVTDILAAVIDTTKAHEGSDSEETISNTPNGIHRCYLSDPVHMEFASKGMCRMLGYTEEELNVKLTPDRKLSRLVYPEDLKKFRQFVQEASEKEGRYHCIYRMRKKDGSIISVFDVMEVRQAASGIMYGYSSVTDVTAFEKAEKIARARLRVAEEEIEKHISQEREMIAEKEKAEEAFQREALQLLEKSHMAQEEANRLVRAISSINSDYSAIYFVDLDADHYQLCRTGEMLRQPVEEIIRRKKSFSATLQAYIESFVREEDKARMRSETQIPELKARLAREEQFFLRYRLTENESGQEHYEMHVVNCSLGDGEHKAAIGFRCLDAAIAEEDRHRQEVEDLENRLRDVQLKNSMSQMQPHFLYNALASIREIVLDDPRYASDLLYDFSTHLRACIRAMSHDDLVPFDQELENINAYVNIEKMRFGEKLHTCFDIRDRDFSIVPLSIQPLVENAIRHGIYERGAAGGTVTVSTERSEKYHVIRVIDDGVGFDYPTISREVEEGKRDSTGLINLIFRLKKIMNAEITVESTPGKGTVITVLIPGEQENKQDENDIGG